MHLLSVVIITHNEEKNIQRCIDSTKHIADEILVLDSYSSDLTKQICEANGTSFYEKAFTGYGAQKNAAVNMAKYDFVLNLDADEFLSRELGDSILKEKAGEFFFDAYTMNRLNFYCGKWIRHGSWYPDRKLRLYNRRKGCWSNDLVHEEVIMHEGHSARHLKGDLMHMAYENTFQHKGKNEKYSTMAAKALFEKGRRTNVQRKFFHSLWAFVHSYLFRLGFLDGRKGFTVARFTAEMTYLKHAKLLKLQRRSGI